jgi:phage terminase small subunit
MGAMEPPPFLSAAARAEWRRITAKMGSTTVLGDALVRAYCQSFQHWREAEQLLEVAGDTPALVKLARRLARDLLGYGAALGVTPCRRARMRAAGDKSTGPA